MPSERAQAPSQTNSVDRGIGKHLGWVFDDRSPPIAGTNLFLKIVDPLLEAGDSEGLDASVAGEPAAQDEYD